MRIPIIFIVCILTLTAHLYADSTTIQPQVLPQEVNYSEKFYGPYDASFGLKYVYHIEITDPERFGDEYLTPMYEEITFNGMHRSFDGTWEFPNQDSLCIDSLVRQAFQESLLLLIVSVQGEVCKWMTDNFPAGINPYELNDAGAFNRQGFFNARYASITLSVSAFKKPSRRLKARDATRRSGL